MHPATYLTSLLYICIGYVISGSSSLTIRTTNRTNDDKRPHHLTSTEITQSERNRRLIPYATYYVAGGQDPGYNVSQQYQLDYNDLDYRSKEYRPTSKPEPEEYGYDYQLTPEYSYVPVAYIPGGKPISLPDYQYYRNPSYTEPKPKPYKVYVNVPTQSTQQHTTPVTSYRTFVHPTKSQPKPSWQNTEPDYKTYITSVLSNYRDDFYKYDKSPSYATTTPQPNYLRFHYANLPKNSQPYLITTTPVVEITSPKHYTISSTPGYISRPTEAVKIIKQETEPTQATMTIMKSHEIFYKPDIQVPQPEASKTVEYFLDRYNVNNKLPERITPDNIKQSIETLSYLLQILHKANSLAEPPQKPDAFRANDILQSLKSTPLKPTPTFEASYDAYDDQGNHLSSTPSNLIHTAFQEKPSKDEENTPGKPGIDYPIYSIIPETSFRCKMQRYKGFFADPDTKCQVWHYCDLNGGQASFLCPNGTIFNQAALTCDWWFNVKCAATSQLYVLNERLYKYILPVKPSFPEDYAGPLVDQYLTDKFKEIETKRKYRDPQNSTAVNGDSNHTALMEHDIPIHLLHENL